ncbi:MAG TPA: carboxypeptidase-like regulatory domain-containing protein, partial [Pyrinomonadaceae bacterium]
MRSSARSALPTLLTCLCFAASVFAQSPGKQQVKTPRGSVSGRITIKSKPAPGVVVGLRKGAVENSFDPFIRAVTDAEGIYRLQNIPAGSYVITVVAPAYIPSNSEDRKSVVLGEDENVEGINFSLVRGGVITGKVTDAEGHPVIQHQIEIFSLPALARRSPQGPFPTITGQTDDRGIYRVYGIAPGSYKVAAGRSNFGG